MAGRCDASCLEAWPNSLRGRRPARSSSPERAPCSQSSGRVLAILVTGEADMKVADVMMGTPASCTETTNLAAAVEILWERNCGIVPVVNPDGKVTGVVTDRDICIALGTRNRP